MIVGLVLDCSVRLDTAACEAARDVGYLGAIRYLYPDASAPKTLTRLEASVIRASGLALGLVWETTAGRALDGYQAGRDDAAAALELADELGPPAAGAGIYFACDTDTDWPDVEPYYSGIADERIPRRAGAYGGVPVVVGALDAGYTTLSWVSAASSWDHGQTTDRADLWQQVATAPPLPFDADTDVVLSGDPGLVPALFPPAAPSQIGATMLELTIDGTAYLFWNQAGTIYYRSIRGGVPLTPVVLSTQGSPQNPLMVGQATAYGPVVYAASNDGRTVQITQVPGQWGLHAVVV